MRIDPVWPSGSRTRTYQAASFNVALSNVPTTKPGPRPPTARRTSTSVLFRLCIAPSQERRRKRGTSTPRPVNARAPERERRGSSLQPTLSESPQSNCLDSQITLLADHFSTFASSSSASSSVSVCVQINRPFGDNSRSRGSISCAFASKRSFFPDS